MITKIFQGPKNIVEQQLASYTAALNSLFSICLSTNVTESKALNVVVIVRHPRIDQ